MAAVTFREPETSNENNKQESSGKFPPFVYSVYIQTQTISLKIP
jgi:hypothetical protein